MRIFRKWKIEFLRKSIENKKEATQIGFETASFLFNYKQFNLELNTYMLRQN